jgi:ADP-ribosylglycohydrolase
MVMDRDAWFEHAYGCLIGQAVGDALGAPTEGMAPHDIQARYGWLDDFASQDPGGTDDTEYSVLVALTVLKYGSAMTLADVGHEWVTLVVGQEGGFERGGISEMDAVYNLRKGLHPPATGSDNHEMWSDGAAMRMAPMGVYCAGNPAEAARLAGIEARISHHRDGVYCAQAIAASVAEAMTGSTWEDAVASGLAYIPQDSWTYRNIARAVEIGGRHTDVHEAVRELYEKIPVFFYPWADVGPEATALAFGVFAAARGRYVDAVLAGANVGRDADTIAAMAGAMAGALGGAGAIPEHWRETARWIRGRCLKVTAGTDIRELAGRFADTLAGRALA